MSGDVVVKLDNVSKYYKLYNSPKDRLKEAFHPFRKKYHKEFYALNDISFELKRGECLGVIGKNGMGKSTLLKIIANVIQPSSGSVQINGAVSALLELGTGFNPEFTGMENIYFYGTILGFRKDEVEKRVKEIVDFADIGEFIDQPVKTYSSGMFVRLAFAVQTSLKPDILLVDEVLSVGDIFFQQKCHARIEELMKAGTAIILVSHDLLSIQKYSGRVLLLNIGITEYLGDPLIAIHRYYKNEYDSLNIKIERNKFYPNVDYSYEPRGIFDKINWPQEENFLNIGNLNYNSELVQICKLAVCDENDVKKNFFEIGELMKIYYEVIYKTEIEIPVGAIIFSNSSNIIVHGKDTLQYGKFNEFLLSEAKDRRICRFNQNFYLNFTMGFYTISIGIGQISSQNIKKIDSMNLGERENAVNGLISLPSIFSFQLANKNNGNNLPFHGLVDVKGDFEIEVH